LVVMLIYCFVKIAFFFAGLMCHDFRTYDRISSIHQHR
jgi:hypothetical protein